ncbi:secretion system apparatus protein SsaU [Salmonella enterica subsp. enterica]|uniref:Secretion system apparatus protein SsaU n=1 Tax=Salmonella enterica I TaxID=59201 RepID=A0A447PI06_SALET|nr:secretion system apparatus protein SsaU [Salmonella enterica subsp. enterica]
MKTRRREMQSEIQSGSLAQSVKQSVAVVRNPTHIAVCLGYHPTDMQYHVSWKKAVMLKLTILLTSLNATASPLLKMLSWPAHYFLKWNAEIKFLKRYLNPLQPCYVW